MFVAKAVRKIRLTPASQLFPGKMGTFVPNISPVTGKMDWLFQDEHYDYHQEIARSAYADMLHDTERNMKYYAGVRSAVAQIHGQGRQAHVLDIGTGTGLLSMMAAACGADSVTACEAFHPMAQCCAKIIKQNGFADKIHVIPKRSTGIIVGPDGDMKHRANILVTEVFDTELIGEGAIGTFHHAHEQLLEDDCLVVPRAANMYVQLVQSDKLRRWNQLQPIRIEGGEDVLPPPEFSSCGGAPSLHDLQLDQLPSNEFKVITDAVQVFRFDYTGKSEIKFEEKSVVPVLARARGRVDAIFMWWDIEMDPEGEIILSCAPRWAHPEPAEMEWRDHWMQAIYYPSNQVSIATGETITVTSYHDEYSLWFDVSTAVDQTEDIGARPVCTCGAHIACSRPRLGMVNDSHRNNVYIQALKQVLTKDSVCLCLGDGSLLPLILSKLGAKKVYTLQTNMMCRRMVSSYVNHNLTSNNNVVILDKAFDELTSQDFNNDKIDLVIGEPFFLTSMLPWHNLHIWYAVSELANHLSPSVKVLPSSACVKGIAMEFDNLWKIRAPVGNCEGFDLQLFDKVIQSSSDRADAYIEPHPLWEYPGTALTQPIKFLDFDLTGKVKDAKCTSTENDRVFGSKGKCNGIALWMEYKFGQNLTVSSGPVSLPAPGGCVDWDRFTRQGVHLLKTPPLVAKGDKLHYKVHFKPATGELNFSFEIKSKK